MSSTCVTNCYTFGCRSCVGALQAGIFVDIDGMIVAALERIMKVDQASLAAYQSQVEAMRESHPRFSRPRTSRNQRAMQRGVQLLSVSDAGAQRTKMPDALINKIIEDLREIPPTLAFQLSPFKVNEPFLDTRLFSVLAQINQRLPNAAIALTTNPSALTQKQLSRLGGVRNLDNLWISMNDHREAEYEATMQLPYRRTLERIRMIHGARALAASRCEWSCRGSARERRPMSNSGGGRSVSFPSSRRASFSAATGSARSTRRPPRRLAVGCTRWFDLSITATGVVAHCCMDGAATDLIGDVSRQHVLEVYNAPAYRRLRERTARRQDAEPCDRCSFF